MPEKRDIEDDPAEMVCDLAMDAVENGGSSEAAKQQFRDALAKFIDARIYAYMNSTQSGQHPQYQPPPIWNP